MEANNIALKMQDITKTFPGVLANDHVNIEVRHGEVLGLLGENGAGKTTLMNILYGLYKPDSGQIFVEGKEVQINNPSEAIAHGIGMVHQHFKLVDTLTVIENVLLGMDTGPLLGSLGIPAAKEKFLKLCEQYELYVDPDTEVWRLPVGKQQWVEILKALYRDAQVLVLDEPTAVLTPSESDQLARAIRLITGQGRSVIFISHKLREVMEITDHVTVLRDGKYIGTIDTKDATQVILAQMMVGRPLSIERRARPVMENKEPVLVMKDVSAKDDRGVMALNDFSLTVHSGEIVGVAGVDGNGQRELAECISGLRKPVKGSISIKGKPVTGVVSDSSVLGYIPEDRHRTGLVLDFTVAENLVIKDYEKPPLSKNGILSYSAIKENAKKLIKKYNIKTPSGDVKAATLSGGNQQKVVIARELDAEPVFDLAAHPTRGLDLGAVDGVHETLLKERNRGAAVLFISAELQEIMAVSDRIIVLYNGRVMGDMDGETADVNLIGQMMLGHTGQAGEDE